MTEPAHFFHAVISSFDSSLRGALHDPCSGAGHAEFTGANLEGARLDDADLRNAGFIGARIAHTSFARANVAGARFVGIKVSPEEMTGDAGRAPICVA